MEEDCTFPKKAAYICFAAPFIAAAITFISKYSISNPETLQTTVYFFSITTLAIGLILGIYSLFYLHKVKGILIPASIGLALSILIAIIGYQIFTYSRNDYIYYEIQSLAKNEKFASKQIILGRIHRTKQITEFVESIKAGLLNACPQCKIIDSKLYDKTPADFKGVFENSRIGYTYIAIDTGKKDIGDIRFIFPELDPQPSCRDLVNYIEIQRQKFNQLGTVNCIESVNPLK
jgi:uncharacterized protein (DUF983 family)